MLRVFVDESVYLKPVKSMNPSEKIILDALKRSDTKVYKELFSKYSKSLFYYACKFVSDDVARDMVQDVFMVLWTQRNSLSISTSLNNYLFGVTRNKCLKQIREQSARGNESVLSEKEALYYETNSDSIHSIIEQELSDKYQQALQQLPPKCLEVFLMSRQQELRNKEIAAKLDISEKAVEKHISKALKHLRQALKEYLPLLGFIGHYIA